MVRPGVNEESHLGIMRPELLTPFLMSRIISTHVLYDAVIAILTINRVKKSAKRKRPPYQTPGYAESARRLH